MVVGTVTAWKPARMSKGASLEERRALEDTLLGNATEVCRRYRACAVTDQYTARAVVERLSTGGVVVQVRNVSLTTKTAAFGELRARLYDGSLRLPDHSGLVAELRRLRSKFSAGSAAVINPRVGGSHGDMAQALAMAFAEHARIGPPSQLRPTGGKGTLTGGLLDGEL